MKKPKKMLKFKPHYSENSSKNFWKAIWQIKNANQDQFDAAYLMGCALQDHEGRVLQYLNNLNEVNR